MSEPEQEYQLRKTAMRRFLAGQRPVDICRDLHRPPQWFAYWRQRYDPDDPEGSLRDRASRPQRVANRTPPEIETMVLTSREAREAKATPGTQYALISAEAIYFELEHLRVADLPTARTIHRILVRHGKIRPRAPAPREPSGKWYPQPEAQHLNDIHQVDFVGPRYLRDDPSPYYFLALRDVVSLHWRIRATDRQQAQTVADHLVASWQAFGCPKVLQMDNGTVFLGSNRAPRTFGRVVKVCLDIGVVPWFIAPGEPWRNGVIEQGNGLLDELLWKRQAFRDWAHLQAEAAALGEYANREHRHVKLDGQTSEEYAHQHLPHQRLLAANYAAHQRDDLALGAGQIIFARMVRKSGRITLKANDKFEITPDLKYEYVRAVVDTQEERLWIYHQNDLVKEFEYAL